MNYLTIDVGGTFIKYGIIDHSGNLLRADKVPTSKNLDDFLVQIYDLIEPVKSEINGIGVSLPGKVDSDEGVVYFGGSLQFLHELPLKAKIEERFGITCELVNDGKAAALAELWQGNLKGVTNGAALILGTGVGGGLILDGKLYQGSHFQAGELSFIISNRTLRGNQDMTGFSHSAVEFVKVGSRILGLADENDGLRVFAAVNEGTNKELMTLFDEYCEKLANLIINLQAVIDISTVVIGGGISQQNILIENIIKQYYNVRERLGVFGEMLAEIDILPCEFRSEANLRGALYQLLLNIDGDQSKD